MSTNHPSPVTQAFDVIHAEMRRLQCENADLRKQVNQKQATNTLLAERCEDLSRQNAQLRGHCARKFGAQVGGTDVTAIVQVIA